MVEIKRHENETISGVLRRFKKSLQQAGILVEARKRRFRARRPSLGKRRKHALFRLKRQKEIEKLRKLGKL